MRLTNTQIARRRSSDRPKRKPSLSLQRAGRRQQSVLRLHRSLPRSRTGPIRPPVRLLSGASAREAERVYLTPSLRIHGRLYRGELNSVYIDCGHAVGGGHAADSYEVTFAMLVRLTPQDGGRSLVEVVIDGTARDRTLNLSNPVFCTGTGRLETEFLQRLEARTRSQPP